MRHARAYAERAERARWAGGYDSLGRSNHDRVCRIKKQLEEQGLHCWLDEEQMKGNINTQMTDGIDGSAVVVVFVTGRYVTKVAGKGASGDDDNCVLPARWATRQPALDTVAKNAAAASLMITKRIARHTSHVTGR